LVFVEGALFDLTKTLVEGCLPISRWMRPGEEIVTFCPKLMGAAVLGFRFARICSKY
jgi:hypothetical protein